MRLLTRLLAICGLPLGLLLVGCALSDEAAISPSSRSCTVAADCGGGKVCLDFTCVTRGPDAPSRVSIELSPPDTSGYARTQLLDVPVEELTLDSALELPVPTEYEAQITDADDNPISANLAIFGSPRIPGRELDVNQTFVAGANSRSIFRLRQGQYVVRIRPTSPDYPGMEVRGFTVRPQAGRSLKQFALPTTYRRLWGEVTSSLSNSVKIAGATVRAYGEKSGLPSTASVTDEQGRYSLWLPATEDTTFRLVATPPAVQQPAWGFEQIVGGVDVDEGRQRTIRLEPTSDELRGSARVQVLGTGPDGRVGAPVTNAFVTLTATVAGVVEPPVYEISGLTDADGVMVVDFEGRTTTQVPLLRARYLVRVVPPINTPYTSRSAVLDLTAAQAGFVLEEQVTLPQRTTVRGQARSATGQPISGALVEMRPLSADNRPGDTITNPDGTFALALDPGPYLAIVKPRGLTDAGQAVPVTAQRIEVPAQPAFVLPSITAAYGQSLRLQVRGALDAGSIAYTRVELFVQVEGEVVSLGRAETDAEGWFSAVVPVSPAR